MEQLTIQSLGFLVGFQEDIKVPGRMEQLTMQSLGFLVGFQEDIKIIVIVIINIIIIIIIIIIINHHHHHLGLPGHSLEVRANLRVLQ